MIVLLGGVLWVISSSTGPAHANTLIAVMIGAYLLIFLVSAARVLDSATMWQDWRSSLALGFGAILLLLVSFVPRTITAVQCVFMLVTCANAAFMTAVPLLYVEFILANPAHPQHVIEAARARWKRILWLRDFFSKEAPSSPLALGVLWCILMIALVAWLPNSEKDFDAVHQIAPAWLLTDEEPKRGQYVFRLRALLCSAGMCCLMALHNYWHYGLVTWRAFAVWMLYGHSCAKTPGIFRPAGWLAFVRLRQASVAALLFVNIASFRMWAPFEFILPGALRQIDDPTVKHDDAIRSLILYAFISLLPILGPVYWLPIFVGKEVKLIHDELETSEPTELYPTQQPGGRP